MMRHTENMLRKGQALVAVVLTLAVVLTIGLSIASRSVTEVSVSTTQEEAVRAQAAAEAAIEKALTGAAGEAIDLGSSGGNYKYTSVGYGGGSTVGYPEPLTAGEVAGIKVFGLGGKKITIYWGQKVEATDDTAPAIEATLFYVSSGTTTTLRWAFDPNGSRIGGNGFILASNGTTVDGRDYKFSSQEITLPGSLGSAPQLRIRMIYNGDTGHYVTVKTSGGTFPEQGLNIKALGQAGQSNQALSVTQRFDDWAPMFDSAVFSGGSLVK